MSADSLFSFASTLVLPGWLLLVLLPRWKYSATLVAAVVIPALLGLLYAWLIVSHIGSTDGGFGSLAEVRALFSNEFLLLAGWIHYLAFDLFIGSWEVRDAQRHGVHHLAVIPCLVLTFLFGPVGLMLYFVIRTGVTRRIPLANGT
jgi:hypothetical protein